jgi:hypothetical protein
MAEANALPPIFVNSQGTFSNARCLLTGLREEALSEHLGAIHSWLPSYAEWLVADLGFAEGKNLHAIYGFGVALLGLESLISVDAVVELCKAAKVRGFPTTLSIHSYAMEQGVNEFSKLLDGSVATIVVLTPIDRHEPANWELIKECVMEARGRGVTVNFVGEYDPIREHVLTERWLDDSNFSIYPKSIGTLRHSNRKNCLGRVGLYIAPNCEIYLCQSLFGIKNAIVGDIRRDRPMPLELFRDMACCAKNWEINGPKGSESYLPAARAEGVMCNAHRESISKGSFSSPLIPIKELTCLSER